MNDLKKISNKKLVKLLHELDDNNVLEETARRINIGSIPLVMISFDRLSNKKLNRLDSLTDCNWALKELCKRMDDGRIPTRVVTLDEVKKFYAQFYGFNKGTTIGLVGDFDQAEIQKILNDNFDNWKSPSNYTRLENKVMPVAAANKSIETPDKANAMFVAGYNFEMKDDASDYPAFVLGNFMLGGGFLNSRLAVRIRQKEGLSYGVGSGSNVGVLDNFSTFQAFAIYAPENAAKLETAFMEEVNKVVNEGFTAEEIAAAKSGWLQSRTVNRAQDAGLSSTLSNYMFLGRTLSWDEKLEKEVGELTPEKINQAMKKYLDPSKITIVKAGDFAKSKK